MARFFLFMAVVLFAATGAHAALLQDLVSQHGSIVQGDKLFDNFNVVITGVGSYGASPNAIDVSGITVGGNHGLQFAGGIFANSLAVPNSYVDVLLSYDVTVLSPEFLLHDVQLAFNGASTSPSGIAQVVETVYDGPRIVGQTQAFTPNMLSSKIDLPEGRFKKLHITKDVLLVGSERGFTSVSVITQTFSQIPVPEPITLAMLAIGAVTLASWSAEPALSSRMRE